VNLAVDGYAVIVIEADQLAQLQSTGQRAGFVEIPSIRQPSPRNTQV
jgi:hypothetical protein